MFNSSSKEGYKVPNYSSIPVYYLATVALKLRGRIYLKCTTDHISLYIIKLLYLFIIVQSYSTDTTA